MENKIKILMTGGHGGTAALGTADAIKKRNPDTVIKWVGPKHAVEGKRALTLEFKIFSDEGIQCIPIIAGRVQRKFTRYTLPSLAKIPVGFAHALQILLREKPSIVVSFGGFAAVPVVFAAYLLRIPVVLHEQTIATGLANKVSARFATKIAIARKESSQFFPKVKTVLTGNPLLPQITDIKPKLTLPKRPTIYITCGSRGAQNVNIAILAALPELLKKYKVIHQTGDLDYQKFVKAHATLSESDQKNYTVLSFTDPRRVWKMYEDSHLVIARAGANTVSEIIVAARPAVFIPIPWTRYNEQTKNALAVVNQGGGLLLPQSELTETTLLMHLDKLVQNYESYVSKLLLINSIDREAADSLANLVLKMTHV
jgi:UDP-N-acetylglucosamine--N-acetylmuramyl-(pentapeptide) pyrophosphoryl-undecaprenol N-acetylglucosamine transferase